MKPLKKTTKLFRRKGSTIMLRTETYPFHNNEKEDLIAIKVSRHDETETGYNDHDIWISLHKDGALSFSEETGEGWMYLYPEQISALRSVLRRAKAK